ncbi:MAG: class I SAM-dependent methyltransferase [Anaerolineae bacterium]
MSLKADLLKVGTDQKHLKESSYKTADKLDVRILTHQKYTQPQVDFYPWIVNQIDWVGDEVVFDIGCGSGKYADIVSNLSAHYFACDLSHGMLMDGPAKEHSCINLDAMTLPIKDNAADVIFANHMIYHIPDQEKAMAEFRRVLKPNGKFIAATNSSNTMLELKALRSNALKALGAKFESDNFGISDGFDLESGADLLATSFEQVETRTLENWLVIPEAQPVIDYIESGRDWYESFLPDGLVWGDYEAALRQLLNEHFASNVEFRVSKKTGAFVCS